MYMGMSSTVILHTHRNAKAYEILYESDIAVDLIALPMLYSMDII